MAGSFFEIVVVWGRSQIIFLKERESLGGCVGSSWSLRSLRATGTGIHPFLPYTTATTTKTHQSTVLKARQLPLATVARAHHPNKCLSSLGPQTSRIADLPLRVPGYSRILSCKKRYNTDKTVAISAQSSISFRPTAAPTSATGRACRARENPLRRRQHTHGRHQCSGASPANRPAEGV